jgi:hypothetical protein
MSKAIAWAIALACTAFLIWSTTRLAFGELPEPYWTPEELADAVGRLAPWAHQKRRDRWAGRIMVANARFGFGDSMLLAAMVRKESSFHEDLWTGAKVGGAKERGSLQVHPLSGWRQFLPDNCAKLLPHEFEEMSAKCSFWTGVKMLRHMKTTCGGSYYRLVASYGKGRCVSEQAARYYKSARNARRHYCTALGDQELCDERWPR